MTAQFNEWHTFIIYIVFGYTLIYVLLQGSMKIFRIVNPGQRLPLYLLAFLTPPSAFVIYHTILVKRCQAGLPPLFADGAFHFLCTISTGMLNAVLPLGGMLLLWGMLKAFGAAVMIRRMEINSPYISPGQKNKIAGILTELCSSIKMTPPKIIYSKQNSFSAFSAGWLKPIMVLNSSLVEGLSSDQIKALVSHELVHIRHHDPLKSWFLHLIRDITFFNPLGNLILKKYLLEKEQTTDQEAVKISGLSLKEYAAVLLKIWRQLLDIKTPVYGMISGFDSSGGMEQRFNALIDPQRSSHKKANLTVIALGVFLFTATLVFLGVIC